MVFYENILTLKYLKILKCLDNGSTEDFWSTVEA